MPFLVILIYLPGKIALPTLTAIESNIFRLGILTYMMQTPCLELLNKIELPSFVKLTSTKSLLDDDTNISKFCRGE